MKDGTMGDASKVIKECTDIVKETANVLEDSVRVTFPFVVPLQPCCVVL